MSRYRLAMGGLLVVAAVVVTMTLWPEKKSVSEQSRKPVVAVTKTPGTVAPKVDETVRPSGPEARIQKLPRTGRPKEQGLAATVPKMPVAAVESKSSALREKAVEAWDTMIEKVAERKEAPTAEQAAQFKEDFHKLDKEDQMSCVQNALNLIPDEQFALFYPILYDKSENADVLDEIFSDALNRDEEIKVPIMKELYKDKEHPMFVESARILDATGELDKMKGEAESETTEEE